MAEDDKKPTEEQSAHAMQLTLTGFVLLVIGVAALLTSTHSTFSRVVGMLLIAAAAVLFGMSISIERKRK